MPKTLQITFESTFEEELVRRLGNDSLDNLISSINETPSITISGDICSGKTTLSKQIAEMLSLEMHSLGQAYREIADKRKMTIEDLSTHLAENLDEATQLDWQTSYEACMIVANGGNSSRGVIVEGRLSGWYGSFLRYLGKHNVLNVYLFCNEQSKERRFAKRCESSEKEYGLAQRRNEDAYRFSSILKIDSCNIPPHDCTYNTDITPLNEMLLNLDKKIQKMRCVNGS